MQRGAIPALLGYVGGFFLLLGAAVSFAAGLVYGAVYSHVGPILAGTTLAVLSGALGLLAFVMTYYSRGNSTERMVGGSCLMVLGIVSGALLGPSVLSIVGAVFCFFAGLVFVLEGAFPTLKSVTSSITS